MLPRAATEHYRAQQRRLLVTRAQARRIWRGMGPEFDASWRARRPRLVGALAAAQLDAATAGLAYVDAVLRETRVDAPAVAEVVPESLAGVASDGRPLDSLLYGSVTTTKDAVAAGASTQQALDQGARWLDMAVWTQVNDAARVATGMSITSRPGVGGYVRMLNPPSCSRCAVQAGKWFRYNAGFQRHPRCDCIHVPANEDVAGDMTTDPNAYFRSLSEAEQDRRFSKAGAQAIRDGADMGQVVNARRGARGLTPAGARLTDAEAQALRGGRATRGQLQTTELYRRQVYTTTEATTVRGLYGSAAGAAAKQRGQRYRVSRQPRLMPESIYEVAQDRQDAIRLLRRYGYMV